MTGTNGQGCERRAPARGESVDDLNLTGAERGVLSVARCFFHSFARPESQAWMEALSEAEARFGSEAGPGIAHRILGVLQAVRGARRSTFMFNPARCPSCSRAVTSEERRLMLALVAVGRGDAGSAHVETMLLCEGNDIAPVLGAMEELVEILPERRDMFGRRRGLLGMRG